MQSKIHIISLGCPKNLVDSDKMLNQLGRHGFAYVSSAEEADVVIVNTCGFIDSAKEESVQEILSAASLKDKYPDKKVVAVGCLTERYLDELKQELAQDVDAFLGVNPDQSIVQTLQSLGLQGDEKGCMNVTTLGLKHAVYLKISEGCSNACSFCAIPLMKGLFRHRPKDELLSELKWKVAQGAKDIHIIAQDTTFYGRGLYKDYRLADLMRDISEVDGVEWFRLLYAYPSHLTEEAIEALGTLPRSARYIDMPIQHINDKMLDVMGRRMTREQIVSKIELLKKYDIAIRTTMIVGFPGEGQKEFQELLDFVGEAAFDRLGVFPYSLEEGTRAFPLGDSVPEEVKQERVQQIMLRQQQLSLAKNQSKVGTVEKVIVDGVHRLDERYLIGRTRSDALDIDGCVYLPNNGQLQVGDMVEAKIVEAFEYDLRAEQVE